MINFNEWGDIAKSKDLDQVADYIVTGKKASEFEPSSWLYELFFNKNEKLNILDFGCGIGRNTYGLGYYSENWTVVGYDDINMINNTKKYLSTKYNKRKTPKNVQFESDWEKVNKLNFDFIVCDLVLQHIHEIDLSVYLYDFTQIAHYLVVSGRRVNDDNRKNTWGIIQKTLDCPIKCIGNSGDGVNGDIEFKMNGADEEHMTCVYKLRNM